MIDIRLLFGLTGIMQEPVTVEAKFINGRLLPLNFTWRQSFFPIEKIYLTHSSRLGRETLYHFSLGSGQMVYELTFNNQTLNWRLIRIYEGNFAR